MAFTTLGLIASLASTAVGVYSSVAQGKAQAASAASQANANAYNADIHRQNAELAKQQARANADAQQRESRQALGRQRAAMAQGGVLHSASSQGVMAQSEAEAELDYLNILYGGELAARNSLAEANLQNSYEQTARQNAKAYRTAGYLNAGATLISGASNLYKGGYFK